MKSTAFSDHQAFVLHAAPQLRPKDEMATALIQDCVENFQH
jgi:hypothetical protein